MHAVLCARMQQLRATPTLIFSFSLFIFSQYKRLMLKKTYSSRLIFHHFFPFVFSQSPIISLQSPIEMGDIISPFPYRKGGKLICWNTSFIYIEIEKGDFSIWWKKERERSIYWSCSNASKLKAGLQAVETMFGLQKTLAPPKDPGSKKSPTMFVSKRQGTKPH